MEDRPTTTSAMIALHGGMQLGNNNSTIYRNCAITYITNITNNCKQCHPAEEHVVSEDTPRDLIPSSTVRTTTSVRLVDCEGKRLKLGDLVETDRDIKLSFYTGDGMIIGLDAKTRKVVHEPLNVEETFNSAPGLSPKYSPIQVVQRAKAKVGQRYDGPIDFLSWCCIDMTLEEAWCYDCFSGSYTTEYRTKSLIHRF